MYKKTPSVLAAFMLITQGLMAQACRSLDSESDLQEQVSRNRRSAANSPAKDPFSAGLILISYTNEGTAGPQAQISLMLADKDEPQGMGFATCKSSTTEILCSNRDLELRIKPGSLPTAIVKVLRTAKTRKLTCIRTPGVGLGASSGYDCIEQAPSSEATENRLKVSCDFTVHKLNQSCIGRGFSFVLERDQQRNLSLVSPHPYANGGDEVPFGSDCVPELDDAYVNDGLTIAISGASKDLSIVGVDSAGSKVKLVVKGVEWRDQQAGLAASVSVRGSQANYAATAFCSTNTKATLPGIGGN